MAQREEDFLSTLEDLSGRVAIVTGGAAGIGLEISLYLAQRGATVYAAARSRERSEKGIQEAADRLEGKGSVRFHHLDLSTISDAKKSAEEFKKRESRIDIIVANGGIGFTPQDELSKDGWEQVFATNHLGHFAFITGLLGLVEDTAKTHGQARIVAVSSLGYRMSKKIDYDALRKTVENDGQSIWDLVAASGRYSNSKLANVCFMAVLDKKLREKGVQNVYCNSCHPGMVATTGFGAEGGVRAIGATGEWLVRSAFNLFANSMSDAAKTPAFVAASPQIAVQQSHGEFWQPSWTWFGKYRSSVKTALTPLASDEEEQRRLWVYSRDAVQEAMGKA